MLKVLVAIGALIAAQLFLMGLGAWLVASHSSMLSTVGGLFMLVVNGTLIKRQTGPLLVKLYVQEYLPSPLR